MDNLVLSNIRQRPTRTLISTAGVALGVILIILNTGLARGMLNDRIRREQGIGAEIQFFRMGGGRSRRRTPCRSTSDTPTA